MDCIRKWLSCRVTLALLPSREFGNGSVKLNIRSGDKMGGEGWVDGWH